MQITTHSQKKLLNGYLANSKTSLKVPEQQVLLRLRDSFLKNAENTAATFAPDADDRTHFQYTEVISSALVNELRDDIRNKLARFGLIFEKTPGMKEHQIKGIFLVIRF